MTVGASSSHRPLALRAGRPRARYLEKRRLRSRADACRDGSSVRAKLIAELELANHEVGELLGGEHAGAMVRAGAMAIAHEEAVLLFPLGLAAAETCALWALRLEREAGNDNGAERAMRLRLAKTHFDAIRVLLAGSH